MSKDGDTLTLVLKRTPDILGDLGRRRLAAGSGTGPGRVRRRDRATSCAARPRSASDKHADLIVANDVSRAGRRVRRRHQRGDDRRSRRRRCTLPLQSKVAKSRRPCSIVSRHCVAAGQLQCAERSTVTFGSAISSIEHLRFAAELGVAGVSRDPAWRARPSAAGTGVVADGAGIARRMPSCATAAARGPQGRPASVASR